MNSNRCLCAPTTNMFFLLCFNCVYSNKYIWISFKVRKCLITLSGKVKEQIKSYQFHGKRNLRFTHGAVSALCLSTCTVLLKSSRYTATYTHRVSAGAPIRLQFPVGKGSLLKLRYEALEVRSEDTTDTTV
ncbi:hypothetical protein NL108_008137 [Boleophthalmus pectinirostris]|nr:hypothetical protein NL108_008137 [Boleophthalmus pectinirostris]